jgi:hypothetical protein
MIMKQAEISEDERRKLSHAMVTLNGNPAYITGVKNDFAKVVDMTTNLEAEWSWPAVKRVVENGGKFKSF